MNRRRFLIVGPPRSGTTVTTAALVGHPDISACGDEVKVDPFFTRGSTTFTHGHESWSERSHSFGAMFDAMTLMGSGPATRAHGMKVAVGKLDDAMDLANCLREHLPDLHVLLVCREDLIAQFASLHRARATGVWHSWQSTGRDNFRLTIPAEPFANYAAQCMRVLNQLRTLHHTHPLLEITYERTIVQQQWGEVFSFLGLDAREPDWLTVSKVSPPARDFVTNYDELRQVLADLESPDAAAELAAAGTRAEQQLRQERPSVLFGRARGLLDAGREEEAERFALLGLESERGLAPSEPRVGFGILEAAWRSLADPDRALRCLSRLQCRFSGDTDWLLFAGVVRCHCGQREQGLLDLASAAEDPSNARARELLAEWSRAPN